MSSHAREGTPVEKRGQDRQQHESRGARPLQVQDGGHPSQHGRHHSAETVTARVDLGRAASRARGRPPGGGSLQNEAPSMASVMVVTLRAHGRSRDPRPAQRTITDVVRTALSPSAVLRKPIRKRTGSIDAARNWASRAGGLLR
jgi:hypothetical protein